MGSCYYTVKVNHFTDSDHAMIYHLRLDGLLIWVRQTRRFTQKVIFKITLIGILLIINISLTKCYALVITRLLYSHNYHSEILWLCLYISESYLCVMFKYTLWKLGQYLLNPSSYGLPLTTPLPPSQPQCHIKNPTITRESSTRISQK